MDFPHALKFLYFPHKIGVENSFHNLMWLVLTVLSLNNEVIFYVESAHGKKTIDSMWNSQHMSFYVEILHLYSNFFVRVWD